MSAPPRPIRRALLLLTAAAGLLLAAGAQALDPDKSFNHYVINTWSIGQGLPQISVQAIAQDHQGYIWVGTQSGPARFDGIRFTSYNPETTPALPGIWTRSLLVDKAGRVWIGTYKGLAVYERGEFRAIPIADLARYPVLDIFAIVENEHGITVATGNGVFDVRGGRLVHRAGSPSAAQSLLQRSDGLWIGGLGGVYQLIGERARFLPLPADAASAAVTKLAEAQGRIWAGTSAGLYVREGEEWRLATDTPGLQHSPTTLLLEDRAHTLWVGSNAGLARFRDAKLVEFVPTDSPAAFKGVLSGYEDREGNLWLGSQWEGVARVWNGWTRRYSVVEGLKERIVWSVSRAPDGRVWTGTNDGLAVLDHGRFEQVLRGEQLPHPQAYNLLAEADRVWIGTRRGLAIWQDGKVQTPATFAPMASAQINGIVRDAKGVLWFPTTDGLFRLEGDRLTRFGQAQGLKDPRVRQLRELGDGRFLVATQAGLYLLEDGKVREVVQEGLPPGLDMTATFVTKKGEWVVGVLSERVYVSDGKRWHVFGEEQGFPANAPFFITEDEHDYLWVAGIRGITRAPMEQVRALMRGERKRVDAEMVLNERGDRLSGQQGYCCNGAGNGKGFIEGGVLWLPSRDGVVAFDTNGVAKNAVPPEVVIERLQAGERWTDVSRAHDVQLDAEARDLAFEFTALSFQDPASVLLKYRLQGYDREWRDLKSVSPRSANYTNLPPGNYTFEVMAANNAGVWNQKPARLAFTIKPKFHETGVFFFLVGTLALTILYAAYRQQRMMHIRQRSELERQVAERTHELHSANVQLEHASQTDPLTGLRNRRYLANQIPVDLAFYAREQARGGTAAESNLLFALVDIDHFKQINDKHGHRAGDRVLQQFAQLMLRMVRTGDYVVRWGGEEFLMVFRPVPRRYVPVLGERIRRCVEQHAFDIGGERPLTLTCSVGLAEFPLSQDATEGVGWEQVLELADAALYWLKTNGRDGWAQLLPTAPSELPALVGRVQVEAQALIDSGRLTLLSSKSRPPGG